jgi:hypothetical protein
MARRLGGSGVERLVGGSSHIPHRYPTAWASRHLLVVPPLFIVIPSPGVCQWGCGHSLTSVVVPHPCHLSVGFPIVHYCLLLLSPVPVMSCRSLSAIVGLHHVRGGVAVWHATTVAGFGRFRSGHVTLGRHSCRADTVDPSLPLL